MRIPKLALVILLAATSLATAADLAPDVSPNIDQERFGWTGAYVGGAAGYGWLEDVDYAPPAGFPNPLYDKGEDWIAGGHAGYLYQHGNFVVGGEVEAMLLDITYEGFDFITIDNSVALKARLGYAVDRFLVSGHAGGAYLSTNFNGLRDWGWTAGANIDYALTDNLIIGAQYTHIAFTEFDGTKIDGDLDLLTARAAWKF